MRVGINLLYLLPRSVGGTETYAAGLLKGLSRANTGDEYFIFLNQESKDWPLPDAPNFYPIICPVKATIRPYRYLYEQIVFPILIKKYSLNIIHSLGYVSPLLAECPTIVTIHDLNFVALKKSMPFQKRLFLSLFCTASAWKAKHIITDSGFSKSEIVRWFRLKHDKISIIFLGPRSENLSPKNENWFSISGRYQIKLPYIVAFSGKSAHKNISILVKAFKVLMREFPHNLVIIGHISDNSNIKHILDNERDIFQSRIITTGYVNDHEVIPILSHADLFVLPSSYEGFGLPILEAQGAGVAVISSNAGSLPEVGGIGVRYFDPTSIEEITRLIRQCLADPQLRSQMIKDGYINLNRFSWEKTAEETNAIYRSVLEVGKNF